MSKPPCLNLLLAFCASYCKFWPKQQVSFFSNPLALEFLLNLRPQFSCYLFWPWPGEQSSLFFLCPRLWLLYNASQHLAYTVCRHLVCFVNANFTLEPSKPVQSGGSQTCILHPDTEPAKATWAHRERIVQWDPQRKPSAFKRTALCSMGAMLYDSNGIHHSKWFYRSISSTFWGTEKKIALAILYQIAIFGKC